MNNLLWWLSLLPAALCGALVAVWALSYVVEERCSVRRVRGTAQRPEETTLELFWSRGGIAAYHRTRAGDDDCFAPFARQYLDRGWFLYRPAYPQPTRVNDGTRPDLFPGFIARRSRSEPDGPIEWRRADVVVPCWSLVFAFYVIALAAWRWERTGVAPVALAGAAGFLLAAVPLGWSALRGLRVSRDTSRRLREDRIEKALREGRVERGMTMDQVRQVLAGWTSRRTFYTLDGGRFVSELWEFSRNDAEPQGRPIVVFFRGGEVAVSTQRQNTTETT